MFELLARDGGLYAREAPEEDGSPFYIKGVTWRGAEGGEDKAGETSAPPHGLRQRDLDSLLRELARNKFNALRLTVNNLAMLRNELVQDGDFDRELNPSLVGQRYLSMLRVVAERAAAHGLLVVVAATRLAPGDVVGALRQRNPPGQWWSKHVGSEFSGWSMSEADVLRSWRQAADALCGQWNVVGADLMSGIKQVTWGKKEQSDWDLAAARIGDAVLQQCPRWLVLVRGIGASPAAVDAIDGGNLAHAVADPVPLSNLHKLAYIARVRGPSEGRARFFGAGFPGSLEDPYLRHWSSVQERTGAGMRRPPDHHCHTLCLAAAPARDIPCAPPPQALPSSLPSVACATRRRTLSTWSTRRTS
jgi:endoglucanase